MAERSDIPKYSLRLSSSFLKAVKRLTSRNQELAVKVEKTLQLLGKDPFYSSLRTHKVRTRVNGEFWVSYVTGDVRISWDFAENVPTVISVFRIGGHSGGAKIYK